MGGSITYNIGSSDLVKKDELTGKDNRYEVSLFNLDNTHQKRDILAMDKLYLQYSRKKLKAVIGRQSINTPFINPQDSRMRPTLAEGVFTKWQPHEHLEMETGWLIKISPRSTVKWYPVEESIGIQSQGINRNGTPGNYAGHLQSKGIGLLGLRYKPGNGLDLHAFNQYTENIFNTFYMQADYHKKMAKSTLKTALQYTRQHVLGNGGHADTAFTYVDPKNKVQVFGARAGWEQLTWDITLNYTRIFKGGRFTMPREWGTEPFFTYLSRERNEGYADVNAVMAKVI